jgi:hypothetical protein
MAIINDVNEVLHRIKVKLYPNYLPNTKGRYIARTSSEATLTIEQVCAALKNRGGFTGSYDDLTDHIRQFFDEVGYQLSDGYTVSMKYFSVHPNIGGTFDSANETHNQKTNPISFRFRTLLPLQKLIDHVRVDIEGLADTSGWIDEFIDVEENLINSWFLPGDQFILTGYKIKVAGDDPSCGMFFVPVANPSQAVKVTRLAENTSSKIIGIVPDISFQNIRIEIRTQFGGSNTRLLKKPRVISSSFVIEHV